MIIAFEATIPTHLDRTQVSQGTVSTGIHSFKKTLELVISLPELHILHITRPCYSLNGRHDENDMQKCAHEFSFLQHIRFCWLSVIFGSFVNAGFHLIEVALKKSRGVHSARRCVC